jgi:3-isopropylmalate/(R)-2-methylmalate dehydratase small subunit
LTHDEIEGLARAVAQDPELEITVDVEHLEVRAAAMVLKCQIKPSAGDALVKGQWDPISQLLEAKDETVAVSKKLPYTTW